MQNLQKMDKNYSQNPHYVGQIEKLSNKHCPIVPLKMPGDGEDDLIITLRSLAENKGFIEGYETAINMVLKLYEEYESKKGMTIVGIRKVFENLISCEDE